METKTTVRIILLRYAIIIYLQILVLNTPEGRDTVVGLKHLLSGLTLPLPNIFLPAVYSYVGIPRGELVTLKSNLKLGN